MRVKLDGDQVSQVIESLDRMSITDLMGIAYVALNLASEIAEEVEQDDKAKTLFQIAKLFVDEYDRISPDLPDDPLIIGGGE